MISKTNPFTISFGQEPINAISRIEPKETIRDAFLSPNPSSRVFIITGVRGSGKTVMLSSISKEFGELDDWIVIELSTEDDMREALAAKLYTSERIKPFFLEKSFNVSFKGVSFSLAGKNPVLSIDDLLERMLTIVKKEGKKVLIVIDEASITEKMKQFALSFQALIRNGFPLFMLVAGTFKNVLSLKNEKNLTFLYRAPKIELGPLRLSDIALSFRSLLGVSEESSISLAKLTGGYAFAYQAIGYLLFKEGKKEIDDKLL